MRNQIKSVSFNCRKRQWQCIVNYLLCTIFILSTDRCGDTVPGVLQITQKPKLATNSKHIRANRIYSTSLGFVWLYVAFRRSYKHGCFFTAVISSWIWPKVHAFFELNIIALIFVCLLSTALPSTYARLFVKPFFGPNSNYEKTICLNTNYTLNPKQNFASLRKRQNALQ